MASLGRFGRRKDVADALTFDFFDDTVRVNPEFGQLDFMDFMDTAREVDENDPSALAVVKDILRQAIHQDDFDVFWRTAKRERQDIEDLMQVLEAIVSQVAKRPTSRPSDSSGGPRTIEPNSPVGSSSPVIAELEAQGRPDLALMVLQRQESLSA